MARTDWRRGDVSVAAALTTVHPADPATIRHIRPVALSQSLGLSRRVTLGDNRIGPRVQPQALAMMGVFQHDGDALA